MYSIQVKGKFKFIQINKKKKRQLLQPKIIFRRIKGPFSDPVHIDQLKNLVESAHVTEKDYENQQLLSADPTKEFLWNWAAQATDEYNIKEGLKIVGGCVYGM